MNVYDLVGYVGLVLNLYFMYIKGEYKLWFFFVIVNGIYIVYGILIVVMFIVIGCFVVVIFYLY